MLLFQRMLLLWSDVLAENRLSRSRYCATKLFSQIFRRYCEISFSATKFLSCLYELHNACFIASDRRSMKSVIEKSTTIEKRLYIRLSSFEWTWQEFYFNSINEMNDDEIKFESCDRIFDVLKWADLNEFEWASNSKRLQTSWLQNSKRHQRLRLQIAKVSCSLCLSSYVLKDLWMTIIHCSEISLFCRIHAGESTRSVRVSRR